MLLSTILRHSTLTKKRRSYLAVFLSGQGRAGLKGGRFYTLRDDEIGHLLPQKQQEYTKITLDSNIILKLLRSRQTFLKKEFYKVVSFFGFRMR